MIAENQTKHTFVVKAVVLFSLIFFAGLIFLLNIIAQAEEKFSDKFYPNVYIDNMAVGGKSLKEVQSLAKPENDKLKKVTLYVLYHDNKIATFSSQTLALRSSLEETIDQAFLVGRSPLPRSKIYQKIVTFLKLRSYRFTTRIVYDKSPINEFIGLTEDQYYKPAKNALFKFENGKVVNFRPEENGLKIQSDQFADIVEKAVKTLKQKPGDLKIVLNDRVIKPEITLAQANEFGIEEFIAEGKSDYTHSIQERIYNLTLAAAKFDGVLIPKNQEFSFNNTVGDISSSTGYKPAYIIKNGRTVLGDGGGVCQVSTTLFRAALNAGLPITQRHAHDYRVSYYENDSAPGFDATVFAPSADLKFKNDTPAYILIQTEIDSNNNLLIFRFYGKKDGRQSTISQIKLYDIQPAPSPVYQDDPTLKRGITKQVDFAAGGAKASFDYKVMRSNEALFEKTFYSVYRPWQAVYLVGTQD